MSDAAHFDPDLSAWVLSRYDDVLTALKEPGFVQTGESGPVDAAAQLKTRADVLAALPIAKLDGWQTCIAPITNDILDQLPVDRPVDLVAEFVKPWCSAIAPVVMEEYLKPLAIGLSDTLAGFLANALHNLIRDPDQFARLRSGQDLMPRAVEELLRHAGPVHTLVRTATADVEIGGAHIASGDRVILRLAAANRDAHRFADAERLDVGRKISGHLALGAGPHSCAGAVVVRMATAMVVGAFTKEFAAAELAGPVEWHEGSTRRAPESLPVILRR
jgi:cytochrome P450